MKRAVGILVTWGWIAAATLAAGAATAGIAVGVDPTGLWLIHATTETALSSSFDLRAEVGFAVSGDLSGLMLATASLLFHVPTSSVDPFAGLGVGAALTPPPYTSALVLEVVGGVRIPAFDPVGLLAQARYLIRWSATGWTAGPVFEAGAYVQF
ncbi:MAG: hypothetical protein PHV11_01020 [Candidatus Bipolaricaulis sp.]|nr:hypothetical protein [Candidatus Bipolaricaulis sp.]